MNYCAAGTIKFTGKSIICNDPNKREIILDVDGKKEVYLCDTPTLMVGNIFIGETYVEPYNKCQIKCLTTGDVAEIEFKSRGNWTSTKKADKHFV